MITINVSSNLKKDIDALKDAEKSFRRVVQKHMTAFGQNAVRSLKLWIRTRALDLAPKVMRKPKPKSQIPLIDTREYLHSFKHSVTVTSDDVAVSIGSKDLYRRGVTGEQLSELLEEGTSKMPARPHLAPLGKWLEKDAVRVGDAISKDLLKKLGP